jgi:hypothetical protein
MLRDALRNYRLKQAAPRPPPPKPYPVPTLYERRFIKNSRPNFIPQSGDILGSTYHDFSDEQQRDYIRHNKTIDDRLNQVLAEYRAQEAEKEHQKKL